MPSIRPAIAVTILVFAAAATQGQSNAATPGAILNERLAAWNLCAAAVSGAETRHRIPRRLLHAISLVESGRRHARRDRKVAWPWTVHADGKGQYFPTKGAAIAHVTALRRRGIANIDVGCMQVNLMHHPKAFASLGAAFDPAHNAAYAAAFLAALKRRHNSWRVAVQHYHSATPANRIPYQKKVYAAWRDTASSKRTARIQRRQGLRGRRSNLRNLQPRTNSAPARQAGKSAGKPTRRRPAFLAQWPPRSVRAQRRAQVRARAWALKPR